MTGFAAEAPGPGGRFGGLDVPDPGFADDDGSADPAVRSLLADWADGRVGARAAVAGLATARLLVPVVAVLDTEEEGEHGHRHEKDSHMAAVSMVTADGRRGLLAFTGVDSLAEWDPSARPVPALAPQVAEAALEEAAQAVVVDVSGPVPRAVEGAALRALAAGGWPAPYDDPEVRSAVASAALTTPGVARVRVEPPTGSDADVHVVLDVGGGPAGPVVAAVAERLRTDPVLRASLPRGVSIATL